MDNENNDIDISGVALFGASFLIAIILWLYPSLLLYERLSINLAKILLIFSIIGSGLLPKDEKKQTMTADLSIGLGFIGIFVAWINSTNNINIQILLLGMRFIFLIILIIGIYGTISGITKQVNSIRKKNKQREVQEVQKISEKERRKLTIKESLEFVFQLIGAVASIATIYQIVITS